MYWGWEEGCRVGSVYLEITKKRQKIKVLPCEHNNYRKANECKAGENIDTFDYWQYFVKGYRNGGCYQL